MIAGVMAIVVVMVYRLAVKTILMFMMMVSKRKGY